MSFAYFSGIISDYAIVSAPYTAAGAFFLALIATIFALSAHRRLRRMTLMRGDSIEDTLKELTRRSRELQQFREELEEYLKHSEARLQRSLQGFSTVRFNPFQGDGSGGNQSFATAFVNEHGDGVVFSAIYARSGQTSVYAKPLSKGVSSYELTDEERDAIKHASENVKKVEVAAQK